MALYVGLDFLLQVIGCLSALGQNDDGSYHLTADFVRSGNNRTLKNIRKLHDNTFDFEGSDTIAGGLD